MVKLNQESCEWLPLKTGWYRGYTFVPVILWQGFSISFKEPRPKVAGEVRDIDADGAKARSTFLPKEGDMKQSFETSKLYYGFPIFILGYQDQTHGYNVTTCSSSYSLGDWLVIGVGSEENAADQIKHYQKFTVNIPDENLMLEMEQAGFISHREKIDKLGLDFRPSELTQAPILDACPVVLDCKVDRIIEEDGICHIFAKILDRLAESDLLDDREHFKNDRFAPAYFMGDGHKRVYRYLDDRIDPMGSFIKKARKKNDKS